MNRNGKIVVYLLATLMLAFALAGCDPTSVDAPTGLLAKADGTHAVTVSWDEVENATSYELYVTEIADVENDGEPGEESGIEADTQEPIIVEIADLPDIVCDKLKTDTEYSIAVSSVLKTKKNEIKSEEVKATIKTDAPAVIAPADFAAVPVSDSQIDLTWTAFEASSEPTAEVKYIVEGSNEGGEYQVVYDGPETQFSDAGLAESTARVYTIYTILILDGKEFPSAKSEVATATTEATPIPEPVTSVKSSGSNSRSSSGGGGGSPKGKTTAEQDAQARAIAQDIANSIPGGSDLQRVEAAATIVSGYYKRGVHKESGPYYSTPYGVFVAGESSCAGCTRALGLVLDYMGISWQHANPNAWTHQWCIIQIDGQQGWADGQIGMAGYGGHPFV
jgi:hypothetical protein